MDGSEECLMMFKSREGSEDSSGRVVSRMLL